MFNNKGYLIIENAEISHEALFGVGSASVDEPLALPPLAVTSKGLKTDSPVLPANS